jgi:hypothetical protein
MKRSRILVLASAFTTAIALAAACGFPDPQLVPDDATETGPDGTLPDGATTADGGEGGAPFDAVEPDAPPPIGDAAGEKPPIDANCDPCDCDGDGFIAADAAACPDAGGRARDCDDLDPRAHPDAGFRTDQPTADTKGDWNCDGVRNRQIPAVNVKCSDHGGLLGDCNTTEGFTADPGCGQEGSYVYCTGGINCINGTLEDKTQGCK